MGIAGEVINRWYKDFIQSQWLRTWTILEFFLRKSLVSAFDELIACEVRWDTANGKLNENVSSSGKWYVEWTLNNTGGRHYWSLE